MSLLKNITSWSGFYESFVVKVIHAQVRKLPIHFFASFSDKKHNFEKYNRSQIDSLGSKYDYLSIMHYSSFAFGNGNVTIIPKDPFAIQLGQRLGLSPLDVQQANLLYRCNGSYTVMFFTTQD